MRTVERLPVRGEGCGGGRRVGERFGLLGSQVSFRSRSGCLEV